MTKSLNGQRFAYMFQKYDRKEINGRKGMDACTHVHIHIYNMYMKGKDSEYIYMSFDIYPYVSLYIYLYSPQMMGPVAHVYYRHAYTYIHIRTYRNTYMCVWRYISEILYICIYVYIHMSSPDDWAGGIVEKFRYTYPCI